MKWIQGKNVQENVNKQNRNLIWEIWIKIPNEENISNKGNVAND